tara:strand:- start:229 stop:795 length:567 start_codon:yes stop_codon:yes gene_type:complete
MARAKYDYLNSENTDQVISDIYKNNNIDTSIDLDRDYLKENHQRLFFAIQKRKGLEGRLGIDKKLPDYSWVREDNPEFKENLNSLLEELNLTSSTRNEIKNSVPGLYHKLSKSGMINYLPNNFSNPWKVLDIEDNNKFIENYLRENKLIGKSSSFIRKNHQKFHEALRHRFNYDGIQRILDRFDPRIS